jgi:hypothetical protein
MRMMLDTILHGVLPLALFVTALAFGVLTYRAFR